MAEPTKGLLYLRAPARGVALTLPCVMQVGPWGVGFTARDFFVIRKDQLEQDRRRAIRGMRQLWCDNH